MARTKKMGRTGIRSHRQKGKFNKRSKSKFYRNPRLNNKTMRRDANKKDKLLQRKIDLYLEKNISKVPKDNKYKDLMEKVYKTDNEDLKKRLIRQANPKNFKNMGKQVNELTKKPLNIHTFFRLVLIFWVVQDKLVKHGIKPGR